MAKRKDNTLYWLIAAAAAVYFFKDKLGIGDVKQTVAFKTVDEMIEYNNIYSKYGTNPKNVNDKYR